MAHDFKNYHPNYTGDHADEEQDFPFTSVAILDEVGLAEDSPKTPLKALHALLDWGVDPETGNFQYSDEAGARNRVAVLGLSNWALDPAKMNRAIVVARGAPDRAELILTAKKILLGERDVDYRVEGSLPSRGESVFSPEDWLLALLEPFVDVYLEIAEADRSHHGLRDFYSFLKMLRSGMFDNDGASAPASDSSIGGPRPSLTKNSVSPTLPPQIDTVSRAQTLLIYVIQRNFGAVSAAEEVAAGEQEEPKLRSSVEAKLWRALAPVAHRFFDTPVVSTCGDGGGGPPRRVLTLAEKKSPLPVQESGSGRFADPDSWTGRGVPSPSPTTTPSTGSGGGGGIFTPELSSGPPPHSEVRSLVSEEGDDDVYFQGTMLKGVEMMGSIVEHNEGPPGSGEQSPVPLGHEEPFGEDFLYDEEGDFLPEPFDVLALEDVTMDVVDHEHDDNEPRHGRIEPTPVLQLLMDNIGARDDVLSAPTRYPLLRPAKGFASLLSLLKKTFQDLEVLLGSSFAGDRDRNPASDVHRISRCLEAGKKVLLVNSRATYDSIYDALNQYYTIIEDRRYVQLGLGVEKPMCRVAAGARLILVDADAEKLDPPLLNRLEKYRVTARDFLQTERERRLANRLGEWAEQFARSRKTDYLWTKRQRRGVGEVDADFASFVGFDPEETPAIVAAETCKKTRAVVQDEEELFFRAQRKLLQTATPEAVVHYYLLMGRSSSGISQQQTVFRPNFESQQQREDLVDSYFGSSGRRGVGGDDETGGWEEVDAESREGPSPPSWTAPPSGPGEAGLEDAGEEAGLEDGGEMGEEAGLEDGGEMGEGAGLEDGGEMGEEAGLEDGGDVGGMHDDVPTPGSSHSIPGPRPAGASGPPRSATARLHTASSHRSLRNILDSLFDEEEDSFPAVPQQQRNASSPQEPHFVQMTTFSGVLSPAQVSTLSDSFDIQLRSLDQTQHQAQLLDMAERFARGGSSPRTGDRPKPRVLLIQTVAAERLLAKQASSTGQDGSDGTLSNRNLVESYNRLVESTRWLVRAKVEEVVAGSSSSQSHEEEADAPGATTEDGAPVLAAGAVLGDENGAPPSPIVPPIAPGRGRATGLRAFSPPLAVERTPPLAVVLLVQLPAMRKNAATSMTELVSSSAIGWTTFHVEEPVPDEDHSPIARMPIRELLKHADSIADLLEAHPSLAATMCADILGASVQGLLDAASGNFGYGSHDLLKQRLLSLLKSQLRLEDSSSNPAQKRWLHLAVVDDNLHVEGGSSGPPTSSPFKKTIEKVFRERIQSSVATVVAKWAEYLVPVARAAGGPGAVPGEAGAPVGTVAEQWDWLLNFVLQCPLAVARANELEDIETGLAEWGGQGGAEMRFAGLRRIALQIWSRSINDQDGRRMGTHTQRRSVLRAALAAAGQVRGVVGISFDPRFHCSVSGGPPRGPEYRVFVFISTGLDHLLFSKEFVLSMVSSGLPVTSSCGCCS